jgi:hypothetical protein
MSSTFPMLSTVHCPRCRESFHGDSHDVTIGQFIAHTVWCQPVAVQPASALARRYAGAPGAGCKR